jgi:hypothetical protein
VMAPLLDAGHDGLAVLFYAVTMAVMLAVLHWPATAPRRPVTQRPARDVR